MTLNELKELFADDYDVDSMYDPIGMVATFHLHAEHPVAKEPIRLDPKTLELRMRLIREETQELEDALRQGTAKDGAKELADLLYVVYGLCITNGMWPDIEEVFRRVHESNMSKVTGGDEPIKYDSFGKVLKGDNYQPPNFDDMEELDYRETTKKS